ncbi:hypothetical protein TRFO_11949 [Tritrichomonas foetus]|uniref:Uncharacterized protein n=1 Tax=Tritrichomonas foetus TaxID=1144522 RepID=A0A1J4J6N5_9EUKA|nr:hypothetical protein TRFO_11949 [Tritrichomonas foetus]|eukprot:OHS93315.1 hypothetical protein TRFO_11949 [Tritrichomonas foetus]
MIAYYPLLDRNKLHLFKNSIGTSVICGMNDDDFADLVDVTVMNKEEEFEELASIQDFIMTITLEEIEETEKVILESDWIISPKQVKQFAHTCVLAAEYRPMQIETIAILLERLLKFSSDENSLKLLPEFLLSSIFRGLYYQKPFPKESSNLCFLFYCFNHNVLTILEIIHQIKMFGKESKERGRSLCWIFCYFAPEIQKADNLLFTQLLEILKKCSEMAHFPPVFRNFYNNYEELESNNWSVFKTRRNQLYHKNTYVAKIRNDDVEYFRELSSSPNFNIDTRIYPTIYQSSPMLQNHPTLIMVAAFFGAIECFKFFAMHNADMSEHDHHLVTLPQFAVAGGNIEIIRLCQMNRLDFDGTIHYAALFHRTEILEWLQAEMFPDLSIFDRFGMTTLHSATESSFFTGMKMCIDNKVDVNSRSFSGWTPIRMAVRHGHFDAVRYLISYEHLDVNVVTQSGVSPIHFAAKYGDLDICMLLLNHRNVDVNTPTEKNLRPIHYAVTNGHFEVVRFLLSFPNILLNARTKDKHYPLTDAIIYDMPAIAKLLISDPRVNVNIKFNNSFTPLYLAVKYNRLTILKALLERDDIEVNTFSNGYSPLHLACKKNLPKFVAALLESEKADINLKDDHSITPLHRAAASNAINAVEELCKYPKIELNIYADNSRTPLHIAAAYGFTEIIYILCLLDKTEVNIPAENGFTALHLATLHGHFATVAALLIRDDVDVNITSSDNITPIHIAVQKGFYRVVDVLLSRYDINIKYELPNGQTVYELAKKKKFNDIAMLLKTHIP